MPKPRSAEDRAIRQRVWRLICVAIVLELVAVGGILNLAGVF